MSADARLYSMGTFVIPTPRREAVMEMVIDWKKKPAAMRR